MKAMKGYWNHTTLLFKILILLLMPVMACLVGILFGSPQTVDVVLYTSLALVSMLETFTDTWNFGGICNKEFKGSELMKSSVRGRQFYAQVLIADCVRRYGYFVLITAVIVVASFMQEGSSSLGYLISCILICSFTAAGSAMFAIAGSRFFDNYFGSLMLAYTSVIVTAFLMAVLMLLSGFVGCVIAVIYGVAAGVVAVLLAYKKMERSYYDQTI